MPKNNPRGYNQYNRKPGDPRPPARKRGESAGPDPEVLTECGCGHARSRHRDGITSDCQVEGCDCLMFEGMA
jgi:hypothetical protein